MARHSARKEMASVIANDPFAEIITTELAALTALTENDSRSAANLLNDAAARVDNMLAGAGREKLRYQLSSLSECSRFIIEMIPHQLEALKLASIGDLPRAMVLLHGHSSVLWRIAAFLQDQKSSANDPLAFKAIADIPDESAEILIEHLDRFLDGEGKSIVVEDSLSGRSIWFHRQDEQLVLDFPVASLTVAERRRALLYFQRIGASLREWDDIAVQDNAFSFMLDCGMNLIRSANMCVGLFREVLESTTPEAMRITVEV